MTFRGVCTVIKLLLGLILLPVFKGEPQLIGSPNPVVGLVGQSCVLPCRLQPAENVAEKTVEWTQPDLNPSYVYILRQGRLLHEDVNPSFLQRANLFEQELKNGNMSLKLSDLKISDTGVYTCKLISNSQAIQVSVIIGAVSKPQIFLERFIDKLVFRCEAKNWYPEPVMEWRDSEGQMVPHDNIQQYTEHDEFYSVYSKIKVDIAASENYTCVVRQPDIREVRTANYSAPEVYGEVASLKILTLHLRGWLVVALLLFISALILGMMMLYWAGKNLVRRKDETDNPGIQLQPLPANESNPQEQLGLLQQQNADLTTENGSLREEVERLKRRIQDLTGVGNGVEITAEIHSASDD